MTHKKIASLTMGGLLTLSTIITPAAFISRAAFAEGGTPNITPNFYAGTEDIYTTSGCKSNMAGTAQYCANDHTLTLNNYNDEVFEVNNLSDTTISIILQGDNVITPTTSRRGTKEFHGSLFDLSSSNIIAMVDGGTNGTLAIGALSGVTSTYGIKVFNAKTVNAIKGGVYTLVAPAGSSGSSVRVR